MIMSKSEAQQTTSPLFLDEEDDLEDVENTVINTALPFDKCLSVDKQCEEEENANKKNKEMLEYQYKLGDIKTTLKDSKNQMDNWFGKDIMFKYKLNQTIIGIIGLVMIVALIYFIPILIKSNIDYSNDIIINNMRFFMNGIVSVFIVLLTFVLFTLLFDIIVLFKRDLIEKKMSKEDYLIDSNVIDYPMKVKKELFNDLVDSKCLYISYDEKENVLKFYKNCSSESIREYNLNKHKNFSEKDSIEYQYWYLSKQLENGRFYRISDIITDATVKNDNGFN